MLCQPEAEFEALVRATMGNACSKQWVLGRQQNVCENEQVRLPDGSEFQAERAVLLKPRKPKVVQTEEQTDWHCRSIENVQECVN